MLPSVFFLPSAASVFLDRLRRLHWWLVAILLSWLSSGCWAQGTDSRPVLIAAYGNSLVAGVGCTTGAVPSVDALTGMDFPAQLSRDLGAGYVVKNLGVPAKTTPELAAEASAVLYPYLSSTLYKRKIVLVWEVTNDVCLRATGPTQAYAHYKSLAEDIRAHGAELIVLTMLPRTTYIWGHSVAEVEQYRNTINTRIRAEWPTFADKLADVADLPLRLPDGTHLDDEGYTAVKEAVKAQLMSLLGGRTLTAATGQRAVFRLSTYPNPTTTGQVRLEFGSQQRSATVQVLNALGQTVFTQRATNCASCPLEVACLPAGTYFVRAQTEAGVQLTRFVRE